MLFVATLNEEEEKVTVEELARRYVTLLKQDDQQQSSNAEIHFAAALLYLATGRYRIEPGCNFKIPKWSEFASVSLASKENTSG